MAYINGKDVLFSPIINIEGEGPNATIIPAPAPITANGTYTAAQLGADGISEVTIDVPPLPVEIATEEEMAAILETAALGSVYKYTGESTDNYESGALYIVEAVA